MAKRGYKLQEFVAHTGDVNCLRIGKKASHFLVSGGDDHIVNLWSIGKPNSLMSLHGHSTPVESLAFDSSEVLVLGGAASGTVKLWDLEEAKIVRTLTGHRSNCTSVEFHPFGEFVASGSADTELRIWDIRKRGCTFTYKGHTLGINTLKFSPDGRWVVSGGFDRVVKVWDLTAGKLLHDLKFHTGHVRSIDFHPLELLLATGSADKTVKFWDLETFEMIGSTKAEAKGVRKVAFHPDGKTLFTGYDKKLKVYSWEPIECHDAVDMGWSTLGDLCINEEKLIGCSYYSNSIGIWVTDLSRQTSDSSSPNDCHTDEVKLDKRVGSAARSSSVSRSSSPDNDDKEIKNIYVDCEKPVSSRTTGFSSRSNSVSSSDTDEISKLPANKQSTAGRRSVFATSFVPRERSIVKSSANPRRESFTAAGLGSRGSIKATNTITKPNSEFDVDTVDQKSSSQLVAKHEIENPAEDKYPSMEKVDEKSQQTLSTVVSSNLESGNCSPGPKEMHALRVVNRAVAHGRTRFLVEKFERRGDLSCTEDPIIGATHEVVADKKRSTKKEEPHVSGRELSSVNDVNAIEDLMQNHDVLLRGLRSRLIGLRMVRHLWEQNDVKGAINALGKLSDLSVKADVIVVLMDKMEIITMDIFSCMLPILVDLLDSKIERHAKMSLGLLLKLVILFGPTICATIKALPSVGLDLHREERIECSKQCFNQLHQMQSFLPAVARRSGSLAKSVLELSLVLQDHNM